MSTTKLDNDLSFDRREATKFLDALWRLWQEGFYFPDFQ